MIHRILALVLLLAPCWALAQERAAVPRWYAELKGGLVQVDSEAADQGRLLGLSVGRNLDQRWGLELEAYAETTDFDGGFERDQEGVQLNLIQVNRVPLWNPYFQVGLGALRYEARGEEDTDLNVSVSIGGMWQLSPGGLMLRADARYRYSLLESPTPGLIESGEPVFTLGLVLPLVR